MHEPIDTCSGDQNRWLLNGLGYGSYQDDHQNGSPLQWNFVNNICLIKQFYPVWWTSVCREMNLVYYVLLLVTFKSNSFGMVAGRYQQQSGDRLVNLTQTAVNCRLSLLSCQLTVGLASSIVPLHQPLVLEYIGWEQGYLCKQY